MCGVNLDLLKGGAPGVPGFCGESAKGYWNSLPRSSHTELLPGVHVKVAFRISIRSVLWVLQRFSFEIKDDCTFEWRLNLDLSGNWEKGSKNSAHRQLNAKHETSKIYVTCNISKRFNIRWQIAFSHTTVITILKIYWGQLSTTIKIEFCDDTVCCWSSPLWYLQYSCLLSNYFLFPFSGASARHRINMGNEKNW